MTDTHFDDYFNDKLRDHEAPVPNGVWDKLKNAQFDRFIGDSFKNHIAPVPGGLYNKITDSQFDAFIGNKLFDQTAPVPAGLWDKVTDGQFDQFIAGKLHDYAVPLPEGLWEKVNPDKENDRKPVFILFRYRAATLLILALLLGGSLGGYLFLRNSKEAGTHTREALIQPLPVSKEPTGKATASSGSKENTTTESVTETNEKKDVSVTALKQAVTKPGIHDNQSNELLAEQPNMAESNFEWIEPYHSSLLTAVTIPFMMGRNSGMQDLSDKKLSTLNHTNQFKNVIICPSDQKNSNTDWFLEAYTSPDIAFKSVTNNTASQQYLLTKDSSESMQAGYSAGLRLVKPITENLLLKAGLNYSQINQKYVYRTENEVKTTTVITVRTIIRAPGDTVIVNDTSTVQQIGFKNNTVYNRYRSFDIPVTIGYQFGNEDLKIGINAGVVFNVSSWYQGVILDSTLATVVLTKSGNGVYRTNLGLGLYAGVSVVKRLSDDLHIFVEPHLRYNLSNMTSPGSAYHQKFSIGGLSLGVRLNLNRK
ncbi:MAG: hypothetical protein Q8L07_07925 [Sediminibacterium sp.]|nr:hypothetical protein [Sediminibacterium sp.]